MTDSELRCVVKPVAHATTPVAKFPNRKYGKRVYTGNRWTFGHNRRLGWVATNGHDNGRVFGNRKAMNAFARFLQSRNWVLEPVTK